MTALPGGLIVSCQALAGNPLRDSRMMAHMAKAAELGGARAIRANGAEDIRAIRSAVSLPIIGINKQKDASGRTVITPTFDSAAEIAAAGADIVALDATFVPSPIRENAERIIARIHGELKMPVMADISRLEEAVRAARAGADMVATTLAGYTPGGRRAEDGDYAPDFPLMSALLAHGDIHCPVVGEGRFWRLEDMRRAFSMGVHAIVVGKAITNPMAITRYYARGIQACRLSEENE